MSYARDTRAIVRMCLGFYISRYSGCMSCGFTRNLDRSPLALDPRRLDFEQPPGVRPAGGLMACHELFARGRPKYGLRAKDVGKIFSSRMVRTRRPDEWTTDLRSKSPDSESKFATQRPWPRCQILTRRSGCCQPQPSNHGSSFMCAI